MGMPFYVVSERCSFHDRWCTEVLQGKVIVMSDCKLIVGESRRAYGHPIVRWMWIIVGVRLDSKLCKSELHFIPRCLPTSNTSRESNLSI